MYLYRNTKTDEVVFEEDWQDYAMAELGISITPKGKDGSYTLEQYEFILEFTEWYFSGYEWTKEKQKEDVEDYEAVMEDKLYEENLDKRLMEE